MENCSQPAIITKDLCCQIYARDSRYLSAASLLTPRTGSGNFLRTLFGGLSAGRTSINSDRVSSVYELSLRRALDTTGSPGVLRRRRKVLDTSGFYVRGICFFFALLLAFY